MRAKLSVFLIAACACAQDPTDGISPDLNGCCTPGCSVINGACVCCPLVFDTTGQGFQMTDIAHGVYFRVQPNGPKYAMAWTDPAGHNGWLVLPDKNGEVHDFTNLFSTMSPQPKTAHPNGYLALAVYDLPSQGGNGNGWIDPGDAIWSKLRIWTDANQDGEAQPWELNTLHDLGIKRIALLYKLAEKTDEYGNIFRYVSQVVDSSDPHCYDVWIRVDPDATKP